MTWKSILFILLLFIGVAVVQAPPIEADYYGTTAATFLELPIGARESVFSNAFVAVADSVGAIHYNPAGLKQIKGRRELLFHHANWFEGVMYENISYAQGLGKKKEKKEQRGVIGGSLVYLHTSGIKKIDRYGEEHGDYGSRDLAFTLSYGGKVKESLFFGANLRLIKLSISNKRSNLGIGFDVGVLHRAAVKNFMVGVCIQNVGTRMKFVDEEFDLPLKVTLGVAGKLGKNLLLAAALEQPKEGEVAIHLGGEYRIGRFSARLGYRSNQNIGIGLSAGVGFKVRFFEFDYVFKPYDELGATHSLSLLMRFGVKKPKKT